MIPTWLSKLRVKFWPHARTSVPFESTETSSRPPLAFPGYKDVCEPERVCTECLHCDDLSKRGACTYGRVCANGEGWRAGCGFAMYVLADLAEINNDDVAANLARLLKDVPKDRVIQTLIEGIEIYSLMVKCTHEARLDAASRPAPIIIPDEKGK